MRSLFPLAALMFSLLLTACNSIETRPGDTARFAAGHYKYYSWRSKPLVNPGNSSDLLYVMDPLLRRELDRAMADKGYVLDPARAQFTVDYLQAMGVRQGVDSQDTAGGIDPIPSARPHRQIDQAMVDNANALSGVKTTNNIALQFNDAASHQEVWRVIITKIVDDVNEVDRDKIKDNLQRGIRLGLKTLPAAP